MSLGFDVFAVAPKPIPSAVPGFEQAVGRATWPPSTSTLISDDDGALLVDCLITEQEHSSAPAGLIDRMTAAYPDLANPYTLWVAAHDLLGTRT